MGEFESSREDKKGRAVCAAIEPRVNQPQTSAWYNAPSAERKTKQETPDILSILQQRLPPFSKLLGLRFLSATPERVVAEIVVSTLRSPFVYPIEFPYFKLSLACAYVGRNLKIASAQIWALALGICPNISKQAGSQALHLIPHLTLKSLSYNNFQA